MGAAMLAGNEICSSLCSTSYRRFPHCPQLLTCCMTSPARRKNKSSPPDGPGVCERGWGVVTRKGSLMVLLVVFVVIMGAEQPPAPWYICVYY